MWPKMKRQQCLCQLGWEAWSTRDIGQISRSSRPPALAMWKPQAASIATRDNWPLAQRQAATEDLESPYTSSAVRREHTEKKKANEGSLPLALVNKAHSDGLTGKRKNENWQKL